MVKLYEREEDKMRENEYTLLAGGKSPPCETMCRKATPFPDQRQRGAIAFSACIAVLTCIFLLGQIIPLLIIRFA